MRVVDFPGKRLTGVFGEAVMVLFIISVVLAYYDVLRNAFRVSNGTLKSLTNGLNDGEPSIM